jgi:universal stress protein A
MTEQGPIIFPTDFSTASLTGLAWAKRMALVLDLPLHVVYSVEEPQIFSILDIQVGQAALPGVEELTVGAQSRMDAFVTAHLDGQDQAVVTRILIGDPVDEIVRYADEVGAAMIVMGAHGYSGFRHLVLGSTTESTLRHARCPVLCVKTEE